MVQNWKKQLEKILLSSDIDFRKIFLDISNRNYINYDKKKLKGYSNLYRIRIGKYRIIFIDDLVNEIKFITIDKRGDVYKGL